MDMTKIANAKSGVGGEPGAGMSLRKRLAHGDALPTGNYGVQDFASMNGGNAPSHGSYRMADHQRGASGPVGGNQANPDHGPHGNYGTGPLPK